MKKYMKNVAAVVLALSLALGVGVIPAKAKAVKGIVVPLTVVATEDGGLRGGSAVSNWNTSGIFSSDLNSYKLSADVYLPCSMFTKDGGSVFIDPQIQFWFPDLGINGYLEDDITLRIGYDFENNCPFFKGLPKGGDTDTEDVPYVKDVKKIGDMIKVEIVDATVNSTLKAPDWDETISALRVWTDPIPTAGDVSAYIRVGSDRAINAKFAVNNASVTVGDKVYKTDYNKSGIIAGFDGEKEGYIEQEAATFNTDAVSVAKTSVKVKKKKTTSVKVTTMFSGDKVSVSSSSSKVAKATYKGGKVTIKGIKKGKATISVKANGKTKKIKVTVKNK